MSERATMSDWFLLSDFSGLRLGGPDARAFAHAQFTVPFLDDTEPGWRLCAWCNPKGRVLNVILANTHQDHVDLILPTLQVAEFAQKIKLYAIGRKLEFGTELVVNGRFGAGPGPEQLLIDPQRGLQLLTEPAGQDAAAQDRWHLADLRAGLAWLSPSSSAQHLPQELGLEARGGLSYRKGCYPGQEIIARVHFLGRQKRILSGFRLSGSQTPDDGLAIEDDQSIGDIISSRAHGDQRIGLAVVGSAWAPGQPCRSGTRPGCLLPPADLC